MREVPSLSDGSRADTAITAVDTAGAKVLGSLGDHRGCGGDLDSHVPAATDISIDLQA